MIFNDWYEGRADKGLIDKRSAEVAYDWVQCRGIKTHDGQKLLVQHILDTDEGLSENSRKILEELIK